MSNINKSLEISKKIFTRTKSVVSYVLKQTWKFLQKSYTFMKNAYIKYLKGQYIEIKGKRIPRTAIAILCVILLYLIIPFSCSSDSDKSSPNTDSETAQVYEKGGIKVYNIRKCDNAACGVLEYRGEEDIEKIRLTVGFFDQTGQEIYEGYAETQQLAPNVRINFTIPSKIEFAYSKLKNVELNPEDLPQNEAKETTQE